MRPDHVIAVLLLCTTGCSDRNLLGEEVWSDAQLAEAVVGFGWNYEVRNEEAPHRNINIVIQPDASYEIQISEYRDEYQSEVLDKSKGRLSQKLNTQLRRSFTQFRSGNELDLYTTMPGCPKISHPHVEYVVSFQVDTEPALTIIEQGCDTPEAMEGRKILTAALAAFPEVNRDKLVAGLADLQGQPTIHRDTEPQETWR
jgi:hypothetical protein